jgi:hypothetical protein
MEQPLSSDVAQLLQDLLPDQPFGVREKAVEKLAELNVSNLQVINALIATVESDPAFLVRKKATEALRASVHQTFLQQHPDLMRKVLGTKAAQQETPREKTVVCPECGKTNTGAKLYNCQYCGNSLKDVPRIESVEPKPISTHFGDMQKWEYLTAIVGYPRTTSPNIKVIMGRNLPNWKRVSLQVGLSILGRDGWELVGVHWPPSAADEDPTYIFKRPLGVGFSPINAAT